MRGYWERLKSIKISILWIALPMIAIGILALWPSYTALVLIVGASLLLVWAALRAGGETDRHSFEGLAALLSCVALVLAGYWYFIERRGVPKLNVHTSVQAWPIGGGGLLVRVETELENVGTIKYELGDDDDFRLEIGQVYPVLAVEDAANLNRAFRDGQEVRVETYDIFRTDQWPLLAVARGGMATTIESGETERRYFKAIVPCRENMVLAVTAIVPKRLDRINALFEPSDETLYWKSQSLSERIEKCRE